MFYEKFGIAIMSIAIYLFLNIRSRIAMINDINTCKTNLGYKDIINGSNKGM